MPHIIRQGFEQAQKDAARAALLTSFVFFENMWAS